MEHLAILSKKRKLLKKIISGEKKIESRWYKSRRQPFGNISKGDAVYFKESGDPIFVKSKVKKVLTYQNLNNKIISEIIEKYGNSIGINSGDINEIKDKKYCILIFLEDVQKIKPFEIDKSGFGIMTAWISTEKICKLKK